MHLHHVMAALVLGAALTGCSGGSVDPNAGSGGGGGIAGDGGSGGTNDGTWTVSQIDKNGTNPGIQPSLALSPSGKLGMAYFRKTSGEDDCTPSFGQPSKVAHFNVVYAGEDDGFTPQVAATAPLVNTNGVSLAFDGAGNPAIAYQGGTTTSTYCGGSDMMMARRNGANWTESTVAADGTGYSVYFPPDVADCKGGGQDYCVVGDVVGLFPALLFTGNTAFVAFKDFHFGFAQDDEHKADVDIQWSTSADVDGAHGAGWYIQARKDAAGNPAIAYYIPYDDIVPAGIYVVYWTGSKFLRTRVVKIGSDHPIGAQIGFAITAGKMAVAWNVDRQLFYSESTDGGATFSTPEVADNHGDTGRLPSMDFDSQGRPVIAYYYCGKYDPTATTCNPSQDAIKIAVKDAGAWTTHTAVSRSGFSEAFNLSMVVDTFGLPAIVMQSGTFDPDSGMGVRQLWLAREVSE